MLEPLYTQKDVAAALRVSLRKVQYLCARGDLHTVHVGRSTRISQAALDTYLEGNGNGKPKTSGPPAILRTAPLPPREKVKTPRRRRRDAAPAPKVKAGILTGEDLKALDAALQMF